MRRLPVLFILAAASTVLATPQASPSWAEWVGDWDGKLKWQSCTAEGEPRASIAIDANDGAMSIDLSPAGSALPALSLVEDGDGWLGQQGDVTVRVKRAKDKLDLAIDLDSGCQVKGTMARASVGIAACDRLAAWARIE